MYDIVALGDFAISLSENLKKQKVYNISTNIKTNDKSLNIKKEDCPEKYEENAPDFSVFFSDLNNNVLFIVNGAEPEANLSLVILEHIRNNRTIQILYFKPNIDFLSLTQSLQENMVRKVLQEKTLSGLFKIIYLMSEKCIENIYGGLPILTRQSKINHIISNTFEVIKSFQSSDPVFNAMGTIPIGARVATIGFTDFENNEDKSFYDFDMISHKKYFYAYNETRLSEDKDLLKDLNSAQKERNSSNGNMPEEKKIQINFNIYANLSEHDSCYFINYINIAQD